MKTKFFAIFVICLVFFGCKTNKSSSSDKIKVMVSIPPLKYIVDNIGKDYVDVNVMLPENASPVTYEPSPKKMTSLLNVSIFFNVGLPFEKLWIKDVMAQYAKTIKFYDLSRNVKKIEISSHHGHDHDHDSSIDPHIWMDPKNVIDMAQIVTLILKEKMPKKSNYFQDNFFELKKKMTLLNNKIKKELEPYHGKSFYIFHPALGYFAKRFHLKQVSIEVDGKEPLIKAMAKTINEIKQEGIKTLFFCKSSSPNQLWIQ